MAESSFFNNPIPTATVPNTTLIAGPGGASAPYGGVVGQFIRKLSSTVYDSIWDYITIPDVVRRQTVAPTSGVLTIDYSLGEYVNVTLSANVTSLVIINWPAAGKHGKLTLEINQGGSFTWTNWGGAKFAGGSAPSITTGSGKTDIVVLHTANGGATVFASVAGQNYI